LRAHAATLLTPADFEAALEIDAEIEINEIDDACVADVLSLAPFGFGNPSPIFALREVEVAAPPEIIKEKHVFVRLKSQGRVIRAKAWNFADRAAALSCGARIDVAICFEDDAYSAGRGYAPWQVILKDVH
jgi:single-stranded-DNA-specific exonuclease